MIKKLIILIAVISGIGTAIGDGIDAGNLVRSGGKYGVDESLNTEPRPGVDVDEMNLQSIDPLVTSALANKMNVSLPVKVGAGLYNGNWVSLTNLFTTVGISDQPTKDAFTLWFIDGDAKKDAEAYWGDTNNNKVVDANEWYHRFNLARTDWDTMTIASLFAAPVTYSVGTGSHNGGGLRWLANFGKDAGGAPYEMLKGTFPNVQARRNQIAANLIDYCDSNSSPTTDYPTAEPGGSATSTTYMGNERTPRINEVVIGLHAVVTGSKTVNQKTTLNIGAIVGGELVNLYGDTFGAATLTVSYSVTGTVTWTGGGTAFASPYPYTFASASNTATITLGANGYMYGATDYYTTGSPSTNFYNGTSTDSTKPSPTVSFTNVSVTVKEVKLTYGGAVVDYAYLNKTLGPIDIISPATYSSTMYAYFGGIQCDDPRQHLFPSEWSNGATDGPGSGTVYTDNVGAAGTPNAANNTTVAPYALTMSTSGKDLETGKVLATDTAVNDPSYKFTATAGPRLSTAYIRNGPMVSPWELGAIHRGAAWETINLKEYNDAAGLNPSTGGGLYTASPVANKNGGDANILDQIKMTPRVESKQKVNLKLQSDTVAGSGVLSALFKKIHIGSAYMDNLRLLSSKNNAGQLPDSGNITGDRWLVTGGGTVYTWDGSSSSWVAATIYPGDGYVWKNTGEIIVWKEDATWSTAWSDPGTEILLDDVKAIVADIKARSANPSTTFKTRAGVVAQSSTLISRTGQINDRTQEEIIGKTINLTTVSSTGYFTVIIIAQSIKDVGPGIFSKDLDLSGSISNPPPLGPLGGGASEVVLNADINGNGDKTDTGIPETITKTAFGSYVQYADEIMAEQKIRADVYKDPLTGKCTIIKMEYLEE